MRVNRAPTTPFKASRRKRPLSGPWTTRRPQPQGSMPTLCRMISGRSRSLRVSTMTASYRARGASTSAAGLARTCAEKLSHSAGDFAKLPKSPWNAAEKRHSAKRDARRRATRRMSATARGPVRQRTFTVSRMTSPTVAPTKPAPSSTCSRSAPRSSRTGMHPALMASLTAMPKCSASAGSGSSNSPPAAGAAATRPVRDQTTEAWFRSSWRRSRTRSGRRCTPATCKARFCTRSK
mmetsp:Transcript_27157/g.91280  ORF Transcript_27157/g.91280 Transcript_27157/m.91280 type:complete len:236 (+) Transcript_27157:725-1432(+)